MTGCARTGYHTASGFSPAVLAPAGVLAGERGLDWPVEGKVAAVFGDRAGDLPLKGIRIDPLPDAGIVASAGGRAVFVHPDFGGYGKTVILEHAGGAATVYSGNFEILVSLGQEVRRGEVIARFGREGGNARRFYFELRENGKAVDPLNHLKKRKKLSKSESREQGFLNHV
ncbi:MAG: peptidoglycan DD-metalloendopeptidase family protein [Candidatus Omnitrophica bacterium]|nr:peptidoglycan DD-metalloendopeptidase family protein [Candidatus Omnitrophota bacterium]